MSATGMSATGERAARAGDARAAALRQALVGEAEALGGIVARVEGEAVVLEGRGLLDRWIRDARLRDIGRTGL